MYSKIMVPVELADMLIEAVADTGCDLVVTASHVPGLSEHIISSNAGGVGSHRPGSVFVVR
jgi:nucleotide-binding universal stress UspA family protein